MKAVFTFIIAVLVFAGCKTSGTATKRQPEKISKEYYLDTVGHFITIEPEKGCNLKITNIVAFVVSDTVPSVSIFLHTPDGKSKQLFLPYLDNMNTYTFGGGARYTITPGGKFSVQILNTFTGAYIDGKIMIHGKNENF